MIEIKEYINSINLLNLPKTISSSFNGWFDDEEKERDLYIKSVFFLNEGDKIWIAIEKGKIEGLLVFRDSKWDTEFFGYSCGKIEEFKVFNNGSKISIAKLLLEEFDNYRKKIKLKFCVASLDVWDIDLSKVLEDYRFNFIVNWGSCFQNKTETIINQTDYIIKNAVVSDLDELQGLIKYYFKGGRFYLDNKFDKQKIDKLYNQLIVSSVREADIDVKVLRNSRNKTVGFFVSKIDEVFSLKVGALRFLIFNPKYTKRGLAQFFLTKITNDLLSDCDIVSSGIELHNMPSMAIHLKSGFKFNYSRNVFHGWYNY